MPNIGVILSGCGFLDGAEIQESVLTLLALDQRGAKSICCAPRGDLDVIDHTTHKPTGEKRSILREAARISRGDIRDAAALKARELDALLIPGGYGAAKNLCTFASAGAQCTVQPDVESLIGDMLESRKPIGAICIAPALVARIAGLRGIHATMTIGNDAGTAAAIEQTGCKHRTCKVTDFVVDAEHRLVTTPAYMLGPGPAAVFEGIRGLVERVLEMCEKAR